MNEIFSLIFSLILFLFIFCSPIFISMIMDYFTINDIVKKKFIRIIVVHIIKIISFLAVIILNPYLIDIIRMSIFFYDLESFFCHFLCVLTFLGSFFSFIFLKKKLYLKRKDCMLFDIGEIFYFLAGTLLVLLFANYYIHPPSSDSWI